MLHDLSAAENHKVCALPRSCRVLLCVLFFTIGLQSHVVLIGQVKEYFAYESPHQHGAIDMTGGFKYLFTSTWGR